MVVSVRKQELSSEAERAEGQRASVRFSRDHSSLVRSAISENKNLGTAFIQVAPKPQV